MVKLHGWHHLLLWNLDLPLLTAISKKRVLLLYFPGGASSGKSTFIKQLRLHKGDGFPEVERRKLTLNVYENLADALNILLDNMKHLGIDFDHEQHKVRLFFCFLVIFWRTLPFVGPLIPLFRTYDDICAELQGQFGSPCFATLCCELLWVISECNTCWPLRKQEGNSNRFSLPIYFFKQW